MTKKNAAKRGYNSKKVYLILDVLVRDAAEAWTVENLGHNVNTTHFFDLIEGETAEGVYDELNGWLRVAQSAAVELSKKKLPLTIEELDKVSRKPVHSNKYC